MSNNNPIIVSLKDSKYFIRPKFTNLNVIIKPIIISIVPLILKPIATPNPDFSIKAYPNQTPIKRNGSDINIEYFHCLLGLPEVKNKIPEGEAIKVLID